MRFIDAFNHFFPEPLWTRLSEIPGASQNIGKRMRNIPAIYDLDERFRVMDMFKQYDYSQVISLGMPPLESLGTPEVTIELARLANDGQAELVRRYPERFSGFLASLPMNAPEAAAREAERAFTELRANGLQIHTNINGAPLDEERFFQVFEVAAKHDLPIFLHPSRGSEMPDYLTENKSRYEVWWTFGWPYETSTAMARLVFSGLLDRLPNLKVLAHHLGAMIPYCEGRVGPGWDQLGKRTSDEDLSGVLSSLKKPHLQYFKEFYADTAVFGSRAATVCGLSFFDENRVLFASDCPFDPERGPGYIRATIDVLNSIDMPQATRDKICFRNAEILFKLAATA